MTPHTTLRVMSLSGKIVFTRFITRAGTNRGIHQVTNAIRFANKAYRVANTNMYSRIHFFSGAINFIILLDSVLNCFTLSLCLLILVMFKMTGRNYFRHFPSSLP